jgi:hypothetical protein
MPYDASILLELIPWFQERHPELWRSMRSCLHADTPAHPNPYHLENDCWSHTMMVCKMAQYFEAPFGVQIAALLHDIGKPAVRAVNPRNRHVRFGGHDRLSAWMALPILTELREAGKIDEEMSAEIFTLILLHQLLHTPHEEAALRRLFRPFPRWLAPLAALERCDALGSFSTRPTWDPKRSERLLALGERMAREHPPVSGEEPVTEWIITPFDRLASSWLETQPVGSRGDLLYDPGFTRASYRESVLEKMPASRRHRALVLLPRHITTRTMESLLEKDFERFLRFDLPMGDRFDEVEIRFV